MRDPKRHSANDLEHMLAVRAQDAWDAMPPDVRFSMRRRLFEMNPINAIKEVGLHFRNGSWSITPYPGVTGFGELGLVGCKYVHDRLCEVDT